MANVFGDIRFAGAKRAPVVFCLDVTGSMTTLMKTEPGTTRNRMDMANEMIQQFFKHILSVYKAADAVEVAFVLFTHEIVMETDFVNIMHVDDDIFRHAQKTGDCGSWELRPVETTVQGSKDKRTGLAPWFAVSREDLGTRIDSAVLHSYQKILRWKKRYDNAGTEYYAPHFILITDGDPHDENDGRMRQRDTRETHIKALNMVNDHAYTGSDGKNLIVPITVGIFDDKVDPDAEQLVMDYARNFRSGYFHVRDDSAVNDFKKAAEFLCKTVIKSLSLPASTLEDRKGRSGGKRAGRSAEEIYGQ